MNFIQFTCKFIKMLNTFNKRKPLKHLLKNGSTYIEVYASNVRSSNTLQLIN